MNVPYVFCPRCGSRLIEAEVEGRLLPACPSCSFVLFRNPKVVAAVIPVQDGRTVLVRRAHGPRKGYWVFPGGYVDLGESVEQAARRETLEETGLHVRLQRLLGVYSRSGEDVVLVVYLGQVEGGELIASDESSEVAWFAVAELPGPERLGFWSTIAALDDWRRYEAGQRYADAGLS